MSTAEELERLVALRDRGVLSEVEFQAEKARVLGQSSAAEGPSESPPPTEPLSPRPSASSEEPTIPGFVASPPGPLVPPTRSPAPTGDNGGQKQGGVLTGKHVLIGLVILVVIVAGTGLGIVLTGGSTPAGASEVFLQPTNTQGQNPFTPNVGTDASVPSTASSALTPTSGANIASYSGNSVGLYGGTLDQSNCNPQQMVTYLEANPSKASAWAAAEGISVNQISTYIGGLTPMTLRYDTRVINHGYVNGQANAIPEILQAGQAVLVDSHGVPRARCYCGNPLTPPIAVAGAPHYVGAQWSRFSPTRVIVVQQSTTVINNFTLINNSTGQAFSRPTGTTGNSDTPAPTCTNGPSMPGVMVCTNPTTTSASQSAIVSTVKAFYRGYLASSSGLHAFLAPAAQQDLLTETAVQQVETTQQYDVVTCSQQPLPFSSYVFPTPTVTGSSGAVAVVGTYPGSPTSQVAIDVAVGEIGGHWEITSFTCPAYTTTAPATTTASDAAWLGVWDGAIAQPGAPVNPWHITLDIVVPTNQAAGTYTEPDLMCSGTLSFVSATATTLQMDETVTSQPPPGTPWECVGGPISLTATATGVATYSWNGGGATGSVTRQ